MDGFLFVAALAYGTLGALAGRAGERWLRRPSAVRLLNRLTGGLFVALAVRLLWPERRA